MLDIRFYSTNGCHPITVDVSENFYHWLSQSEFSKIGISNPHKMKFDCDEVWLNLVDLNQDNMTNRQRFKNFLVDNFVDETDKLLLQLSETSLPEDFYEKTYKLRKLQELRKYIEDPSYHYLERF